MVRFRTREEMEMEDDKGDEEGECLEGRRLGLRYIDDPNEDDVDEEGWKDEGEEEEDLETTEDEDDDDEDEWEGVSGEMGEILWEATGATGEAATEARRDGAGHGIRYADPSVDPDQKLNGKRTSDDNDVSELELGAPRQPTDQQLMLYATKTKKTDDGENWEMDGPGCQDAWRRNPRVPDMITRYDRESNVREARCPTPFPRPEHEMPRHGPLLVYPIQVEAGDTAVTEYDDAIWVEHDGSVKPYPLDGRVTNTKDQDTDYAPLTSTNIQHFSDSTDDSSSDSMPSLVSMSPPTPVSMVSQPYSGSASPAIAPGSRPGTPSEVGRQIQAIIAKLNEANRALKERAPLTWAEDYPTEIEAPEGGATHACDATHGNDTTNDHDMDVDDETTNDGDDATTTTDIDPYTEEIQWIYVHPTRVREVEESVSRPGSRAYVFQGPEPPTYHPAELPPNVLSAPEDEPPMMVPHPDQAAERYQRDGHLPPFELIGAVDIRAHLLDEMKAEVRFARENGLLKFIDRVARGEFGYGLEAQEVMEPFPLEFGSPFLWPEEQHALRQVLHFWKNCNLTGTFDERVARVRHVLSFRSSVRNEERIRKFRDEGRLGHAGQVRRLVSLSAPPKSAKIRADERGRSRRRD